MRQGQSKRMRGRGRGGGGGGNGGSGGGKGPNPLTRSYESNGPDVKIRGTAGTIADKYVQLSRDALTSGDPVGAENYMQHAEHYYRLLAAAQAQYQPHQTFVRADAEDFNDVDFDGDGEQPGEANSHQAGPNNGAQPQQQGGYQNNGYQQHPRQQNGRNNGQRDGGQDRRDRQDFRRNDNGSRGPDDGDRQERGFGGGSGPSRIDPAGEQPIVGELPAFITGGGAPARPVDPEPAPSGDVASSDVGAAAAAQEHGESEQGESAPSSRGGRRRRYGRSRGPAAEDGGDAGSQPPAEPSSD